MLGIIFKREFRTTFTSKGNIIGTLIIVLLLLAAGVAGRFLLPSNQASDEGPVSDKPDVALTQPAMMLLPYLEQQGIDAVVVPETTAQELVSKDEPIADVAIGGSAAAPEIYADGNGGVRFVEPVRQAATLYLLREEAEGVSPEVITQVMALNGLTAKDVSATDADSASIFDTNPIPVIAGIIGSSLVFFMVASGLGAIPSGVVEEKSSRVVEIVLTTVRPRTLLLGKVLGIGVATLLTMLIYLATAIVAAFIAGVVPDLGFITSSGLGFVIAVSIIWIPLGYLTVAALAGGVAATVSRQEDLASILTPQIFLQFIPFYLVIFAGPTQVEETWFKVISYIPGFAGYAMPLRAGAGTTNWMEQLIAIGLSVVGIILLARLGGAIYERSILRMGERVKLTQIFRKAA